MEENPWLMTLKEEAAWMARIRQERETPEYKQREANKTKLAGILAHMLLPLILVKEAEAEAELETETKNKGHRPRAKAPRYDALAELAMDEDCRREEKLFQALKRYAS